MRRGIILISLLLLGVAEQAEAVGYRTDPAKGLVAVRDAIRADRASGKVAKDAAVTVTLSDGIYRLSEPLAFGSQDGNVVWRAERKGGVLVTGLCGLEPTNGPNPQLRYWRVPGSLHIPGFGGAMPKDAGVKIPDERQLILFQSGTRLPVARWPNDGFAKTGEMVGPSEPGRDGPPRFRNGVFRFDADKVRVWSEERDLWAKGLWYYGWAQACMPAHADVATGTVGVDPRRAAYGFKTGAPFFVLNAVSEIDRPGEWAVDRASRTVTMLPPDDADVVPAMAAVETLLKAEGVSNLCFSGIVFEGARGDALVFKNCRDAAISCSRLSQTGGWGVRVEGGSGISVIGCDLDDLGEGGVFLSGGDRATLTPGGHRVANCHISNFGKICAYYRPGVSLRGVGNMAENNLIHHADHMAVDFAGNEHRIVRNLIHDVVRYSNDAGAIYCCTYDWTQRGTVIEGNVIHMVGKLPKTVRTDAIYIDDWSSGTVVRGNIINRASIGVNIGGGRDNAVYGNLFLNCENPVWIDSRGVDSGAAAQAKSGRRSHPWILYKAISGQFKTPAWRTRYPSLSSMENEDPVAAHDCLGSVISNNVFVASGKVGRRNWEKVSARTALTNNVVRAIPGFVDYGSLDWRFTPSAEVPTAVRGTFAAAGLVGDAARYSPAVKFGSGVTMPLPLKESEQ